MGATMTQHSETLMEQAMYQSRRVRALLIGLEASMGQLRIGSIEFDMTLRNLVDLAREETATLCKILEGSP
jgi:hypothetical protein